MATSMIGYRAFRLRNVSVFAAYGTRISQFHTMHRIPLRCKVARLSVARQTQCNHLQGQWPHQATLTAASVGATINSHRFNSTQAGKLTLGSEELRDTATTITDTEAAATQTSELLGATSSTMADPAVAATQTSELLGTTAQQVLEPIKEVPFSELGLGGYTPVGILQHFLEGLHMSVGLPWWGAIAVGTIFVRLAVFPVMVKQQRHAANMNNHMPRFQELTKKMNEARASGDQFDMMKTSQDMQKFMKKHDVNPLKSFLGILVQAPVFISFFIGLRQMATLPVESMTTGGMFWFTDLSIADPYYALPLIASFSMLAIIQMGGEAGVSNPQAEKIKKVMKFLPFVILPITASLPQAIFMYWITSNTISAVQVAVLKIPTVRKLLKIPERVVHDPAEAPKSEGFFKGLKSGWNNAAVTQDVMQQKQAHLNKLKEAGTGPVPQTFAYDPTQPAKQLSTQTRDPRKKIR